MYTLVTSIPIKIRSISINPPKSPPQPSGHHRSAFCHKLALPGLGFYINRSIQHAPFCVWLLSLSRMFPRFIHAHACLSSSFLFIAEFYFFLSGLYFLFLFLASVHWPETVYCVTLEKTEGRRYPYLVPDHRRKGFITSLLNVSGIYIFFP